MTTKLQIMIYLIFFGIICAAVYAYYNGKVLGGFIKRLKDGGRTDESNAASLKDLGYSGISAFFINISLGENSSLRRYVKAEFSAQEMEVYKEKKLPQRYYIPEESAEKALKRYDGSKVSFGTLILSIVACIIAAVISINLFPYLISMFSGVDDNFRAESDVVGERVEETVKTEEAEK